MINIGTDCAAVIDQLWNESLITHLSTHLYQIIREMKWIKSKWAITFRPIKIIAHQDEKKSHKDLTPLERLNITYDLEAKALITTEEREFIPFPFTLSLPYLTTKSEIVINSLSSLEMIMSLHQKYKYL